MTRHERTFHMRPVPERFAIADSIPDPTRGEGWGIGICPACTADRNGGRP